MNEDAPEIIAVVDGKELESIFDCDMIHKITSEDDGKQKWQCGWCGNYFGTWNATKAISHVMKLGKMDIKICRAKIDAAHLQRYKNLFDKTIEKRIKQRAAHKEMSEAILIHVTA